MRSLFAVGLVVLGSVLVACSGKSSGGGAPQKTSKIDLLFMIDNSASMGDKQAVLARSAVALVTRLVNPTCVAPDGTSAGTPSGPDAPCPSGTQREFKPVTDIHVGVVTSSLGGHGSTICSPAWQEWNPSQDEHGHLLGLTRSGLASYNGEGFLAWDPAAKDSPPGETDHAVFGQDFANMVTTAGENGCGYEAQLEAWYRFLVDPDPPQSIEKDANGVSVATGTDAELLAERANFLRPDSLLAIVMITDENDCSVADTGLGWLIGRETPFPSATSICATKPNDPCCHSCAQPNPSGCAHDPICDTQPTLAPSQDSLNLRCWDQKRRFGIANDPTHPEAGLLYPTQRYSNALTQTQLCPSNADLSCASGDQAVQNPIFSDLTGSGAAVRKPNQVFLAGIVGVPWQDIATADTLTNPDALTYMTSSELASQGRWDTILGDPATYTPPKDPLMQESVDPRSGSNPITGDAVAPATAGPTQNPINGHEWTIANRDDLQYACIFPLEAPKDCSGGSVCDCGLGNSEDKPLCQDPATGQTPSAPIQYFAKAYPGLRELAVLKAVGDAGIVASVCPKIQDTANAEYGYNPALDAIVERLKSVLF